MVIEHRYPQALEFLREHGPDAVAVLHVLAAQAEPVDGRLVGAASTRGVAGRLGFLGAVVPVGCAASGRGMEAVEAASLADAVRSMGLLAE